MRRGAGFTIVELMVLMTIMVILMTLAVVNMRSTQLNARDKERAADVESIARQLDTLYTKGVSYTTSDFATAVDMRGGYPSTGDLFTGSSSDQLLDAAVADVVFGDISEDVLIDPLAETQADSFKAAINAETDPDMVAPAPGADYPYVYQPLLRDGSLCSAEGTACTEFNIYYRAEVDGAIIKFQGRHR